MDAPFSDFLRSLEIFDASLLGLPDGGNPPPLIEAEPLCLSRPYTRKPRVESEAGK